MLFETMADSLDVGDTFVICRSLWTVELIF